MDVHFQWQTSTPNFHFQKGDLSGPPRVVSAPQNTTSMERENKMLALTFIPLAIGLNIGIGAAVKALSLPLYVDSIGTIMATLLLGWKRGAIVGSLGFIITGALINPYAPYFIGTQIAIALFTHFAADRGWFRSLSWTALTGVLLGVVAALVSAPVIVMVFGGATGNGAALLTAFFTKMGNQIVQSVFLSGFSIEPIDKGLQCILAYLILRGVPQSLLGQFDQREVLRKNAFIR